MNKITEFDVTYCTKEYLLNEKWMIIAYNPPGSQGTFTIPNPHKNPKYRGQTGSISPDIVAYKKIGNENIFLFVEAKPDYNKDDEEKMVQLFKNQEKKDVFIQVVEGVAKANNIPIDFSLPTKYKFAKAHSDNKGDHLSKM